MSGIVVDAYVALALILPDESSHYADAVLSVAEKEGLRVPSLWSYEIANGLALAYARKRITPSETNIFLTAISRLRISIDDAPPLTIVSEGSMAAMQFGLTAYDAVYVNLALREKLPLATLDNAMRKAAEKSGVIIFNN